MTKAWVKNDQQKEWQDLHHSITLALPHDVRTPLTGILTAADLLETQCDELEGHEVQRIAQIIHRSANRLHDLLQNFLLCAQIEVVEQVASPALPLRSESDSNRSGLAQWMGRLSLDSVGKTQGSLHAPTAVIAEAALERARRANREADLTLELDGDTIQMVEAHLNKIAQELLDNAFRYSETGTPVRVTGSRRDHRFALSIADSGRGMTADQIAHVGDYVPFDHDHYDQQGLGLGLVIAKRLTELYGGKLTLDSAPGHGTTAHLLLPA
jgi:two-component system sensor histidine kinase/response regulator